MNSQNTPKNGAAMRFSLLALVGILASSSAFAVDPATSTVTTVTASTTAASTTTTAATAAPAPIRVAAAKPKPYVPPSDCGTNSDALCGGGTDADGDTYYTDSKSRLDCDDTEVAVHPNAAPIIGDDADQNCDGKGDDAELADALQAVKGGEASPAGKSLKAVIKSCVESVNEGGDTFAWKIVEGTWTCVAIGLTDEDDKPLPDAVPDGLKWIRGAGMLNVNEQTERSSRIAGDRKALLEAKASAEASLKAITTMTETAKAENKQWLEAKAKELDDKVSGFQAQLRQMDADIRGENDVQNSRLANLESSGVIFGIGATAQINAGRSYLESKGGPVVRSGIEEIASATALIGYETPLAIWALNLNVGYGSTESNGGSVPVTAASAGVSAQYRVPNTSMAIGPTIEIGADSTGNVIVPQSSAMDFAGGLVAAKSFDWADISTKVVAGVQNVCYNDFCDNGAIGKFSVTVAVRNHH